MSDSTGPLQDGQSSNGGSTKGVWLLGGAAFLAVFVGGFFFTREMRAPPLVDRNRAAIAPAAPAEAAPRTDAQSTIAIPSLGLHVRKPPGWYSVSAETNTANIRRVEMADKQLQELVVRYANVPIVAFSKFDEPYPDLNPSFKITVRPAGGLTGRPAAEILAVAVPTFQRMFPDLQVEQPPTSTTVSGHRAAYARLAYTLRAGNLAAPTISEIWLVPRGSVLVMIAGGTRADERNGTRAEVRDILAGVRIDP